MLGLERLRVVEVGTAVSIPLVGAVLANLGADVLKVESRQRLDINRARIPRAASAGRDPAVEQESFPLLHELNPAKKSVTLNLKNEAGFGLFRQLLASSDVFIENYAPGWLARLGLPWDDLLTACPRLIALAASAYGEEGPLSQQRAYAPIMTGLAGLEGLIGYEDGAAVGMMATALSDPNAAYFGVLAVFAALLDRQRTGRGCLIDLSQTEAAACLLGTAVAEYQLTGEEPVPRGNARPGRFPHDFLPCAGDDCWIALSIDGDGQWHALAAAAGPGSGLDDPRFTTAAGRHDHRDALLAALSAWTRTRKAAGITATLQEAGVACTPVLGVEEMESDPRLQGRQLTTRVTHPLLGEMDVTGTPWHINGEVPVPRGAGPVLGTDTRQVMADVLGISDAGYAEYDAQGAFE